MPINIEIQGAMNTVSCSNLKYNVTDFAPNNPHDGIKTTALNPDCLHFTTNSIASIKERLLAMPKGSWVFLDLDDTVFVPTVPLLRTVNKPLLQEHLEALQPQYPNIRELIWAVYDDCDYTLIEDEIFDLISDLKEKDIHVLGLTKRRTGYATQWQQENQLLHEDLTSQQLRNLGVTFSTPFPEGEMLLQESLPRDPNSPLTMFSFQYQGHAIFKDGIAFTSSFNKGVITQLLLQKAKELGMAIPPQIALIDDLLDNLEATRKALESSEEDLIPFLSIHYSGASELFDNEHTDLMIIRHLIQSQAQKRMSSLQETEISHF